MALQGAELVLLGYNTPSVNIHWNEPAHLRTTTHLLVLQGNAHMNGMWVAAAAKCGSEDGFHMFRQADLGLGERFRQHIFDFAKHRRPEHYGLITERVGAGEPLPQPPGNQ